MIEVYDLNLKRTAVLQNAFGGEEEEVLNDVPSYTFQIPSGELAEPAFCGSAALEETLTILE